LQKPDAGKSFHYASDAAATTTRAHAHKIFKCICTSLARVLCATKNALGKSKKE